MKVLAMVSENGKYVNVNSKGRVKLVDTLEKAVIWTPEFRGEVEEGADRIGCKVVEIDV